MKALWSQSVVKPRNGQRYGVSAIRYNSRCGSVVDVKNDEFTEGT